MGATSKDFNIAYNKSIKFKIRSASSPNEKLYAVFGYGLLFAISFGFIILCFNLSELPIVYNFGFYDNIVIIGSNILVYVPFLFYPLIENERSYIEINNYVDDQILGKVRPRGLRHHKWIRIFLLEQ